LKVLVTGGSGFIGTHLVDLLIKKGYQVRVLDRRVPKVSGVEWMEGDLRWLGDCDRAVRGVDAVMHLAARISVDESLDFVWEYFNDNLMATINIFHASITRGVNRIIFTSSCEVYGNTPPTGAREDHPCNPTSPYAASKYAAERAALAFKHVFPHLKLTILRPFNTFGEWQRPFRAGAVIPTFILSALQNKPLVIHGKGDQTRDFLYVKDIALAHVLALEKEIEGIFNIASGVPRTIISVAEAIVKRLGMGRIEFQPDPRGGAQVQTSVGNAENFMKASGWKPEHDFEKALDEVVRWYKEKGKLFL
jgi:UDP-glucose 4-epimerase